MTTYERVGYALLLSLATFYTTFVMAADKHVSSTSPATHAIVKAHTLDSIVAIVNEHLITQQELLHQVKLFKLEMKKRHRTIDNTKHLSSGMIQRLININLQLQLAKRLAIKVTPDQVHRTIENIAEHNHISLSQLKQSVSKHGMTFDEYRNNIKREIIVAHLQQEAVGRKIHITKPEVTAYLAQHRTPHSKLYQINDIIIPLSEHPSIQQLAHAKKSTELVLKKIRLNPSAFKDEAPSLAYHSIDLGWRTLQELPTVFAKTVRNMHLLQVAGPLKMANGLHIIQVEGIKSDPKQPHLTREKARKMIYQDKFGLAVKHWLRGLRAQSYIKVISAPEPSLCLY